MMFYKSKYFIFLVSFLLTSVVFSQNSLGLKVVFNDSVSHKKYEFYNKDTLAINKALSEQLFLIESEGYINLKVYKKNWVKGVLIVKVNEGEKFLWGEIKFNETLAVFYREINFSEVFNPKEIKKEFQKVLAYCENNGYPFASINFNDIAIESNQVNATASLILNDYFIIDSIAIKGETKTNRFVIYREIGVLPGDIYNEKEIKSIEKRVNSSLFLSFIRSVEISFTKGKALLTVFVNDKGNNKFGGILGINSDENTGDIILSGDVNLSLINSLKNGERLALNWRKTRENTQNFFVSAAFPYLFKSKIGFNTELSSLRRDTTFSNLGAKFGLSYQIQNNQYVSLFIKNNSSNSLLGSSSVQVPIYNTSNVLYYGMEFSLNNYDYYFNPRRGFAFEGIISSGVKNIVKNSNVLNIDYTSKSEKSNQYELQLILNKFIPIFSSSTLFFQVKSGQLFNESLFENELYQLGGLKSLRGFNEQGIIASNYVIGTFEYRFLFDQKSAFFSYIDYGYIEKRTANFIYDSPYGFGIGVNLAVNSGVFSLSYGLGTEQNNPILFKNSKVHFGFITVF